MLALPCPALDICDTTQASHQYRESSAWPADLGRDLAEACATARPLIGHGMRSASVGQQGCQARMRARRVAILQSRRSARSLCLSRVIGGVS